MPRQTIEQLASKSPHGGMEIQSSWFISLSMAILLHIDCSPHGGMVGLTQDNPPCIKSRLEDSVSFLLSPEH